jgi:hypothetical protein
MYTNLQKHRLVAMATAVDVFIGDLAREIADYPVGSFRRDMREALSADQDVPFTVEHVLDAMHNWSLIAVRRFKMGLS